MKMHLLRRPVECFVGQRRWAECGACVKEQYTTNMRGHVTCARCQRVYDKKIADPKKWAAWINHRQAQPRRVAVQRGEEPR